jgi:hypothetical protein
MYFLILAHSHIPAIFCYYERMAQPKAHAKWLRLFYFWTGIIATLAYRIIIVLNEVDPLWVKISWYVGTIGFIIYFIHRYEISEKRAQLISDLHLDDKLQKVQELSKDEKDAIGYILGTLKSTKEKWNYIFIFVASAIALLWGMYTDFFM